MKLNSIVTLVKNHSDLSLYISIILLWSIIASLLLAPFSIHAVERILENSPTKAEQQQIEYLTPLDTKKSGKTFTASDLQNKVYQNVSAEIGSESSFEDGRVVALRKFLLEQNSPMMPYAKLFVTEADKYGADWRTVVAISGIESRFGKVLPQGSYNAWGWRGGPGGDWSRFDNWEHAIKHLTERMALGYGRRINPYDIEPVYCPPCAASGNNWARAVVQYMYQLDQYVEKNKISSCGGLQPIHFLL